MGKLQDRENKRKSIIGGMIDAPAAPAASIGSRGRPKEDRELKKRISLSVLPSLYEDIQKIAYVQRKSTSEVVQKMMEGYWKRHIDELGEYNRLQAESEVQKLLDPDKIPAQTQKAIDNCLFVNRKRFT